jgi:hypothetical protein
MSEAERQALNQTIITLTDRFNRLKAASLRVWQTSVPHESNSAAVMVSKHAMDELGRVISDLT